VIAGWFLSKPGVLVNWPPLRVVVVVDVVVDVVVGDEVLVEEVFVDVVEVEFVVVELDAWGSVVVVVVEAIVAEVVVGEVVVELVVVEEVLVDVDDVMGGTVASQQRASFLMSEANSSAIRWPRRLFAWPSRKRPEIVHASSE